MNMSYDAANLTTPDIKWLGVRPSDLDRFNIPQQCRLPMTVEDIKTGEKLVGGRGAGVCGSGGKRMTAEDIKTGGSLQVSGGAGGAGRGSVEMTARGSERAIGAPGTGQAALWHGRWQALFLRHIFFSE
jgi:hypothetical protein